MSYNKSELIKYYDYAFIGLGCGNSLLFLEMEKNGLLVDKNVIILEPEKKTSNDKTFCFWMEPSLLESNGIKDLICNEWVNVNVINDTKQGLKKYSYFHIPALSLYEKVKNLINKYNIEIQYISFTGLIKQEINYSSLALEDIIIKTKYIFDNRPPNYNESTISEIQLYQSFYGWEVSTLNKRFDTSTFTMMDFNVPQEGFTQFMYVLPYNENYALFEITRFGDKVIEKKTAEEIISNYLIDKGIEYKIERMEKGVIRMFNSPFKDVIEGKNIFNTGERGGSLKPTTGYSFVRSLYNAKRITNLLVDDKIAKPHKNKRFAYYDRLLLQILNYNPNRGKDIFTQLFTKNKVETVLNFLDEKTSPKEEFAIFASLPLPLFILSFFRDFFWMLRKKISLLPPIIWMSVGSLLVFSLGGQWLVDIFLIIGIFVVGIPHGALDHLYSVENPTNKKLAIYMVKYLSLSLIVLFLFWLNPLFGVVFFLLFSSWHFGETDFSHWQLSNKGTAFAWGIYFLGGLLLSHSSETQIIIQEMGVNLNYTSEIISSASKIWIVCGGLFFSFKYKKSGIIFGVISLIILQFLPLISSFVIFFIGQHSIHGWSTLKTKLDFSDYKLWRHALPFTLGAIFLLLLMISLTGVTWGQLFIFLSALSFPHVYYTTRFNSRL